MVNISKVAFYCVMILMVFMVFLLPSVDYEEGYRYNVACSVGFSLKYVDQLIWLPVYQFILVLLNNLVLARLFSVLCVGLCCFLVKQFSVAFSDEKVAVATSLFYLLNPLVIFYGSQALSESLTTLLILAFAYLFCVRKHVFASVVLAVAVLTSYTAWVFIPYLLFYAFWKRERRMVVYIFPILTLVWWGVVNWRWSGNPTNFLSLASFHYEVLSQEHPFFANTYFSLLFFPIIYPLTFTFPFYIYLWFRKPRKENMLSFYFITSGISLLVVGQILGYVFGWARYFIPFIPFIISLGSDSVYKSKYKNWMVAAYFVLALISTFFQALYVVRFKHEMLNW